MATGAWSDGDVTVFSAGSDAIGAYTVTINGTQDIGGLSFKDGTPLLTGGTLNMTSDSFAFVADGLTATVDSAWAAIIPLAKAIAGTMLYDADLKPMKSKPPGILHGFRNIACMMSATLPMGLLTLFVFSTAPSSAAIMSANPSAPLINDEDIANYGDVSGTDKWWTGTSGDSAAKGQTFTTGGAAVRLKSISYQISGGQKAEPIKTYAIRVGKVAGTTFTEVHAETATQDFTWNAGEVMTWSFDTPVLLDPFTTYGIDVGLLTSTTGWQTGIPYLNITADEFASGARYSSGVSGTGTSSVSYAISSDRIFHLDIERPLGPVFGLVATSPADDATNTLASRELVLTFSQDVAPGSGNLLLRDLTDPVNPIEILIPANDPALTYDRNVVRIDPSGLLDWSKDYAMRIDAGTILGDGGAPIAAIDDDTTWNFTTLPSDPLLDTIAALKAHITGSVTLSGTEIATHKTTIDNLRQRFAESTATIEAVFDLITTYDTAKGPLFVSGSTVTDFSRNITNPTDKKSVSDENIHWVLYTVMQHAMDVIYTAQVLAEHEAQLTGYKFGSHTDFPGPCPAPADPPGTHTVVINGSFPVTFGRNTQAWTLPARKPTGTYLAPGTFATVTVPAALVNAGYKVRVGAHSWDLSGRAPVQRLERATRLYPLDATTIKVASPYGGGIYIEVPLGADAGVVSVSLTGAVRAPYFSAKSFHQTTPAEWDAERNHPAPWADFQSEKFMTQVPRKWIYNMTGAQAVQLMADWDAAMDAIDSLMGFPTDRGKETMYCQPDVILRSSVHAPGYPAVNISTNPNSEVSPLGYAGSYLVRGPGASPTASNIEFHEQGHAYGFPKFGGESESNVNLLQAAMLNRAFGYDFQTAHRCSLGSASTYRTLDHTAVTWMTVFNFSPREVPMANGEKAYQLKGHAKFMDIANLFGWEGLDAYWHSFMQDDADGISYGTSNDDNLLRLSRHVGWDIRPLFHFWGIHPQNPEALAAAIAAASIPASPAIRERLRHYKTLVPADNAAFRAHALAWWGKQPSINGYWTEREHSRQWDQAALFGAGDQQRADVTTNEEYIPDCADQIKARVDELVDLYFPSAITPNPMSFAIAPTAADANTIGMVAATASAAVGPIEYLFEETSGNPGGNDSGWQTSPSYQDTGLTTGLAYTYQVTARDGLGNLNVPSAGASASTTVDGDITPPSPDPMSFATAPYALDEFSITMTATVASDINGVEYFFECTSGNGNDSVWQASPTYTNTGLSPVTEYRYRVMTRDSVGNETGWSGEAITNTADIPDTVEPQIVSLSPSGPVSDSAANLVATFTEPVVPGNGNITIKNLTDGTQSQVSVNHPSVTVAGSALTIDPEANLPLNKTFAVRIDSNALADTSSNPFTGISDDGTWAFNVILEDPLADAGGPYEVLVDDSLSLDGRASLPSEAATIDTYEWDLDNDGDYDEAISGATPAAIGYATLTAAPPAGFGMTSDTNNIQLRVTDSAGKTSTAQTTVTLVQQYTFDGSPTSPSKGDTDEWNLATNWDTDIVPSGALNVAIPDGNYVAANSTTIPAYTGNLKLGAGSTLQVGWNGNNAYPALGTPGSTSITMDPGSFIRIRAGGAPLMPAIQLKGDAMIRFGDSTQTPAAADFNYPVAGSHALTLQSNGQGANPLVELRATNTFSSLVIKDITGRGNPADTFKAAATGALGLGDVTTQPNASGGRSPKLVFADSVAGDAMADGGTLDLNGTGPSGDGSNLIQMDANETIGFLNVNAFPYPAGTYGRVGTPATVDHQYKWIAGNSVLTVTSDTGDLISPTAVTFANNSVNGEVFLSVQPAITYTLTFNEPVVMTATTTDFANIGTASASVTNVTQTSETNVQVTITAGGTGSVKLRINDTASFVDLFGNSVVLPITDSASVNVLGMNLVSQLGILNLSANNGVNPATGNLWKAGDTYRFAFVSSTTSLGSSTDIASYNAFVLGVASSSTTYPNLGSVTWHAIGSTATIDARDNTATNPGTNGTGESVFNMNLQLFATNYAELWDGDARGTYRIQYDENGVKRATSNPDAPGLYEGHGAVYTGTTGGGTKDSDPLGGDAGGNVRYGLHSAEDHFWVTRGATNLSNNFKLPLYGLSEPLIVQTIGSGAPEIAVEQPAATDIPNGGSTNVGTVTVGSNASLVFTIHNTGTADLNLTGTPLVAVTGTNAADFIVTLDPSTPVAAGGNTTFTVQFAPGAAGIRSAMLSITNNDSDENPFTITVTGTGSSPYDTWADGAPFDGDLNGDGVDNGVAWALGAPNPATNAAAMLPAIDNTTDPDFFIFTYRRSDAANVDSNTAIAVQYGSELSRWTTAVAGPDVTITPTNNFYGTSPGIDKVEVKIRRSALAAGGKLFARLHVVVAP